MRSLSEILFDFGFFPLLHESVKHDFISWYYEASKSDVVEGNLAIDNSQLSELAQEAQIEAESFDENNPLSELIEIFEEWKAQIEIYFYYTAAAAILLGCGLTAAGILQIMDSIFSLVATLAGGLLMIGSVGAVVLYRVVAHQVKTNAALVTKFNEELAEKPGDIRQSDQDWHRIAAQFFWNKSLLSPTTHICLMLLSVIRVLSTRVYGTIVENLREEIQEFVGMNTSEIIKQQFDRVFSDDLVPRNEH